MAVARVGLDPVLAAVLACPQDKGPLYFVPEDDLLYNPRLRRTYAVENGIPVLLIDEAADVDPAAAEAFDERIERGDLRPTCQP
ncbi:Trm112 family protein [Candidatus Poriferisodalis sp.]|uniref:Trm112 family protein n=1 Tax=Candidatus Poriferisodalis sp. TaxID=3101277 RepID=UPI003B02CAE9